MLHHNKRFVPAFNPPVRFRVVAAMLAFLLLSCGKEKGAQKPPTDWEPYISAYTSGAISREGTIRVMLRGEVAADSLINTPLEKPLFRFTPSIKGTTIWSDSRTLEFKPERPLEPGNSYKGELQLAQIIELPKGIGPFAFDFSVLNQSVEVTLGSLEPVSMSNLSRQRLSGTLRTADIASADAIEQVVTATQSGRALPVSWEHTSSQLTHTFSIDSIHRTDDSSQVVVKWNGKPVGARASDQRTVRVPSLGEFSILEAVALTGSEQGVSIRFSDPLEINQSLTGLITLSQEASPRFAISGNEIRAYFSKRITGVVTCMVSPGIRNSAGKRFSESARLDIKLESLKPAVRFAGKGVILPDAANLTIPFEAVNLSAVDVTVIRIYEDNIAQFLQVNDLDGDSQLRRVGRTVFKQTVSLNTTPAMTDRWISGGFDISPLLRTDPGALYRIELTFRREHSLYPCDQALAPAGAPRARPTAAQQDDDNPGEESYWDYSEEEYDWQEAQENRDNPCHPAYYRPTWEHKIFPSRNFLASNIGLSSKQGAGDTVYTTVTNLSTALPLAGADVTIYNYQNRAIGSGRSDNDGFVTLPLSGPGLPYLCVAKAGNQKGFLRLDNGSALPVSHFDVGGETVPKGLKGTVYGERGVWRPGDSLYLTFVLEDQTGRFPQNHPVTLELINPRGQLVQTITRTAAAGRFYDLRTATPADAPTGTYTARFSAGGATFEHPLKIEMVMPNRLKVNLDLGTDTLTAGTISGQLTSRWLTGAPARELKADIEVVLKEATTVFPSFAGYEFNDPARSFESRTTTLFQGSIDNEGSAQVRGTLTATGAPGMLSASFRTRVFEKGGAFSVNRFSLPFSPYKRYVGLQLPRGDRARGMLLTDTTQTVHLVTVSAQGRPLPAKRIQVTLYKVNWRWWWQKGDESFADYLSSRENKTISCDTLATGIDGRARWQFKVTYPHWGRYLVRAVDLDGGHACGKTLYLDWPDWAGKSQKEIPGGATVLTIASDKEAYAVGEKIQLELPGGDGGRILVTLENGSRILRRFWVDSKPNATTVTLSAEPEMAPTTYVTAMYLQKYEQTVNDLPMRMYGVLPIAVSDPQTKLQPRIKTPAHLQPDESATIEVSEENGRQMTYTLALVDEGLLDLTSFKTPDLWNHFYKREALGVRWWDLYDQVSGAYGARLERLLAIGGDDGLASPGAKQGNRFPPMVVFKGPFQLKRGATDRHQITIPRYVGSVRVMVVAGDDRAYGNVQKAVPVRKPLMVLGTLPRVLGPQETVKLPISVFALEPSVREVSVQVKTSGPLSVSGESSRKITFSSIGDELVTFDCATTNRPGWATLTILAQGNGQRAEQTISIEIRNPTRPVTTVVDKVLEPQESWNTVAALSGVAGTNSLQLEVSRFMPLDLGKRLDELLGYPHGCAEQITSQVFPQLYLDKIIELNAGQKERAQKSVQSVIARIQSFQTSGGGFAFWPGGGDPDPWVSSYTGHFLLEARAAGYSVPSHLLTRWQRYQSNSANEWSGSHPSAQLIQAYRLYTLALAQAPQMGAMNRLRESSGLESTARWRLAAAYALAGQKETARALADQRSAQRAASLASPFATYGSPTRDRAMVLETMVLLDEKEQAAQTAQELARELSSNNWMSTQTTAYALMAIARFTHTGLKPGSISVEYAVGTQRPISAVTNLPLASYQLTPDSQATTTPFSCTNSGQTQCFVRLIARGTPAAGTEVASSNGIELTVRYLSRAGEEISPSQIEQGTDFAAEITVARSRGGEIVDNVALSQIFASGWEIRNVRMEGLESEDAESPFVYRDYRDDRVYTYFSVDPEKKRRYRVVLHAAYQGAFNLPPVYVEGMYDGTISALEPGSRVEVVESGK